MGNKTVIKYSTVDASTKKVNALLGKQSLQATVKTKYSALKRDWDSCEGSCAQAMKTLLEQEKSDAIEAANLLDKLQKMIREAAQTFEQQDKNSAKSSVK